VDVLITVYNGAAYLVEAVASIQSQTLRDIRLIIVDDGSTDATPDLLEQLAARDQRIVVLRERHGGIAVAPTIGLSHCRAPFVARFDADDVAYAHRLQTQVDYLNAHPECVAVGGGVDLIDASGQSIASQGSPLSIELADANWAPAREPYLIHPYMMVRRDSLAAVGGYRPMPASEDSDLCWRLSELGKLHVLPVKLGKYRMHANSISAKTVIHARLLALCSQLAAISASRRGRKVPDLEFAKGLHGALLARPSLEEMWQTASNGLEPAEARHLRVAASAKLMELISYRPFRLERSDYEFICDALQDSAQLSSANQKEVRRYLSKAVSQFALQWGVRDAFRLSSSAAFIEAMVRVPLGRTGLSAVAHGDTKR
jgi:glycosyltransferase involved in cell wall biosynthesis